MEEESKKDSSLTLKAIQALEKGELLSEEVMAKLVINRVSQPDCEFNGFILDDFPQTLEQLN